MKNGFEADFWIAPLLRFYDKFTTDQLVNFIKALDNKFANDWLVGYTITTRIEKVNSIIQSIDDARTPNEVLQHDCMSVDSRNLIDILQGDIYGKRAARYVLLKLP